jgi:RNA polymerase sigma-70 factor, ECF subfamily
MTSEFCEVKMRAALPTLRRRAFRVLGNEADADDAVQEGLLAAYVHRDQFRGEAELSTWLWAIVNNCARMQLRKRVSELVPLDPDVLVNDKPNPEKQCRLKMDLTKAVASLSPCLRQTFHLRHVQDLKVKDVARILGIPHGSVKARLSRARAKMRIVLQSA